MREIVGTDELMQVCKALSAPLRVQILRCILEHGSMNLNALAEALGVTNGAMTAHIKLLSAAGLVSMENRNGRHGVQKVCRVGETRLMLNLLPARTLHNAYETEIPIGSYTDCQAYPTCGLATRDIVWAYCRHTTRRRNGFKTGEFDDLMLWTADKKSRAVRVADGEQAGRAMQVLNEANPDVLLGYSKEIEKLYRKDPASLRGLRDDASAQQ